MSERTEINPDLNGAGSAKLSAGTILADKYEIMEPLNVATGEADLYLCRYGRKEYVAKMYRRQRGVKPEVIAVLQSIRSPFVAALHDTGVYNSLPFVILPYYKNGSLQGRKFTFGELKNTIIPCINQALRVLHKNGIIHKDLKPSNIMLRDDNKSIALIDFGISSVEEGNTVLVTRTGMTPEYSAPETFRNLFLEESDYYSLGITVYELFCGRTPYKDMSPEEIARFTAVQKIPFPGDMPQELQDFISAVTYFDITNRNNKENPNRRWTHEEVVKWCYSESQVLPGKGGPAPVPPADRAIPPYPFCGQKYTDLPSLITALAGSWSEGKKQVYRGLLSEFFRKFNPELASYCMDAEEKAARNGSNEDLAFWEFLYKMHPGLRGFFWKEQKYDTIQALGRDMLERLWQGDETNFVYWDSILYNRILSGCLKKTEPENEELISAAAALESGHLVNGRKKRAARINYYTTAYLLSGQRVFCFEDKWYTTAEELAAYMESLANSSYHEFELFCHKMLSGSGTLNVQLEAWLTALGKRSVLDSWREQFPQMSVGDEVLE